MIKTIRMCDCCRKEEDQEDREGIYWACRHYEVNWKVPEDGGNGGEFKGILCVGCRKAIYEGILVAWEKQARRGETVMGPSESDTLIPHE